VKPYKQVAIVECGESLVPVPPQEFAFVLPHPYEKLGAPYGQRSPFYLRQGVLNSLLQAQAELSHRCTGWKIQIFDAYRPVAVQQFMVDYTFQEVVQSQGLAAETLTPVQRKNILEQVYQFWAVPSFDTATPPPHSTGAAVDVTLVDADGAVVDMGSEIDELSPRSYPNHFATCTDTAEQKYHQHRQLLREVMLTAGFQQHPNEWWHFCLGDQMWAWLVNRTHPEKQEVARYGRVMED
jgi:D-alanyl-D-alanine dipeptidase